MIGHTHLTPDKKAQNVAYWEMINDHKIPTDETVEEKEHRNYSKWVMKLLVNGNYETFKGYEHKIRPTIEDYRKHVSRSAPKEYGALITVALPEPTEHTPEDIKEKLHSCDSITEYIFSYEFYSDNGNNFNPHIHIFLYGDQHKSNIIKLFSRFFKVEKNFVDFKKTYNRDQNENSINYIKGEKKDPEKQESVKNDKIYRSKKELLDYYQS